MKTAVATLTLLALVGVLGGCSDEDTADVTNNATSIDAAPSVNAAAQRLPTDNMDEGALDPIAAANDSDMADAGAMLATFPVRFQGRWGLTTADCDPARTDNKGLMTIGVDQIRYYESIARPLGLTLAGTKLRTELSVSGEGQSWSTRTVFELIGSGRKLVRSEESPAGSFAYTKCAA